MLFGMMGIITELTSSTLCAGECAGSITQLRPAELTPYLQPKK